MDERSARRNQETGVPIWPFEAFPLVNLDARGSWSIFATAIERLCAARFRNDIVSGVDGSQILRDDPSGNPIELFQPAY